MTAIYQTHHLNLQVFVLSIVLKESLFVSREFEPMGKQICSLLKDVSPPEQMFPVNLLG